MTEELEIVELTTEQMDELALARPEAVSLLQELQLRRCQVTRTAHRTGLLFTVPAEQIQQAGFDSRREFFDRQLEPITGGLLLVIDGTLKGLPAVEAPLCVVAPPSAKSDDTRIYLNKTGAEALRNVLNTFLNNADTAVSFTAVSNHTNQAILLIPSTQADFEMSEEITGSERIKERQQHTLLARLFPAMPGVEDIKPRRFTTLAEVAAYHGLQIAPAIPLVNGLPSDVNATGWTISLTTARYTKDRALTPEEQAEYAPHLLNDLLAGLDSRCQYDGKVYQYVTEPTTVLHDPEGMWCVLYLK